MTIGDRLARLGGADLEVLRKVPPERPRFVQTGLALLTKAAAAALLMAAVLRYALALSLPTAALAGLILGVTKLNIDRLLVLSMAPKPNGWLRWFLTIIPRAVLAGTFALLASTAVVLLTFEKEINLQIEANLSSMTYKDSSYARGGPSGTELADVEKKIREANDVLKGNIPGLTSPSLEQARQTLKDAEGLLEQRKKESYALDGRWRCELAGSKCEGGSGKVGDGPLAQSLRKQLDEALAVQRKAQTAVNTAQAAVDQELELAKSSNAKVFEDAQAAARAALPKLTERQQHLQALIKTEIERLTDGRAAGATGLLARINALSDLRVGSPAVKWAQWLLFTLFFMIEMLPLTRATTSLGAATSYDLLVERSGTGFPFELQDKGDEA